jgi:glycine/D-amino acid oxidase-like deaminating enzyme
VSEDCFDLTIVGGGIVGAMLAWRACRRHPEWRILWFDRSLFGGGASAYSGGLITPYGRTPVHRTLASLSARLLDELMADIGALPIRELLGWYITATKNQDERLDWFVSGRPSATSPSEVNPLRSLMPALQFSDGETILGPFPVRQGWPVAIVTRVRDLCRRNRQFVIWEGVELSKWTKARDSINLSISAGDPVETRRLALALGPWLNNRNGPVVPHGIRIKKVSACHLEIAPAGSAPVILFGDHDAFLLPLPEERRWLFSFPSPIWDVDPLSSKLTIDSEENKTAASILNRYVPGLAAYKRGGRVFCDSYTENRVPLVCCVGGNPDVVFVGGCSGSGFRLAPGMAEQAMDLLEHTN